MKTPGSGVDIPGRVTARLPGGEKNLETIFLNSPELSEIRQSNFEEHAVPFEN